MGRRRAKPRTGAADSAPAPRVRDAPGPGEPCPCGLGPPYDDCCGPAHRGEAAPPTAERLMRSRFSAFAVGDEAYLLATWDRGTRPRAVPFDAERRWTRLEVVAATGGGLFDAEGTVEFRAHSVLRGRADVVPERSRFTRDAGRWVYVGPAGF